MKLYIWICLLLPSYAMAQGTNSITGKWKTIDDETGEAKSVVKIYEKEGKYYGKIVKLFRAPGEDPDPICEDCPEDDSRYKEKIIGMEIIKDLKKDGEEYIEGTVLKPDEGRIYKCKLWLDNNKLKVRGYWGFLYRTQTWIRTE
ncbi:DUF2147 domain-containing protein [Fulvivirga ulvae]|uniref:DUF2147 domain-containing protein n=1 Tax=Fulvivirga ulvae TaxID=2904245 RepID=UPI001F246F56|nr:DUF2147 domain-containing protein [Fulvivirga ulvae]UII30509.1 DUF2147 domain-containing protein [Fulvivirga ulvae]